MTGRDFHIPTLVTERLTMRAPSLDDLAPLVAFYASDRARFVGGPKRPDETWRMLATEAGHWILRGYGRWAVEERATGALVGLVGLWEPDGFPELELGYDLMNGFEGRGFATEAARAARAFARERLGRDRLISVIAPGNEGSKRVARRLGAAYEADFDHRMFGRVEIWHHPARGEAAA